MEATLQALGGLLLKALPTFLLVVFLHFYLKYMFFKPLEKVLHQRYEVTEGARKTAEAAQARSREKSAQYEAALRAARAEIYQDQDQMRRTLEQDRVAQVRAARATAEAAVAQAKTALAAETAALKKQLEAESESLAERIAMAVLKRRVA